MKKRQGKISIFSLCSVTLLTIVLMAIELSYTVRTKAPYYAEKITAAQHTAHAFATIRHAIDSMHIPIDKINDPNKTGLIGRQFSPLTIERGDLQVKLTATNPNIAAMVVHLLKRAGVRREDTVAVYMTGSTPALNIATIIALETIDAIPIIITSVGSAMWGANYPDLTMLDMERILRGADIINTQTAYATVGGHDEAGQGFSPEGRALIDTSIIRNGIPILHIQDISGATDQHIAVFMSGHHVGLFISISEQPSAISGFDQEPGLIPAFRAQQGNGLIPYFSKNGIPVIHLTQLHKLTALYDLPVAPVPLPAVGEGKLFYEYRNSVVLAALFLALLSIIVFFVLRYDLDALVRRRQS